MKYLSICTISFMFLISISFSLFFLSLNFLLEDLLYFLEWEVVSLNSMNIVMIFLFDWMSSMFMSFVLLISSLVIFYWKEYMTGDVHMNRFIMLVLMFVLSMMILIISPNLISILLGLVSYCLVIYFQKM